MRLLRDIGWLTVGLLIGFLAFKTPQLIEKRAAVVSETIRPVDVPADVAALTSLQRRIVAIAKTHGPGSGFIYRWGGFNPPYFDCSGYVGHVLQDAGVENIPRTSYAMWWDARAKHVPIGQVRPGDVLFFIALGGRNSPGHVGIAIGQWSRDGRQVMYDYHRTGYPARISYIRDHPDFIGAARWWHPVQVPSNLLGKAVFLAHRFHEKIQWGAKKTVQFIPRHGWAFVKWARKQHYSVHSTPQYINITFVKK